MTERLTINLTDSDIELSHNDEKGTYFYEAKCPICDQDILITRAKGACCACDIEWSVDLKIKGSRAVSDDDKFQMTLSMEVSRHEFNAESEPND